MQNGFKLSAVASVLMTGTVCGQPLSPLWGQMPDQLDAGLAATSVWQYANRSTTSRKSLFSFSYDFWGGYQVFADEANEMDGSVGWLVEGGRPIGSSRFADLGADIGSGLGINDDLDAEPIVLSELWWRQSFADGAVVLTVGKIDATAAGDPHEHPHSLDANGIANDETTQFLATPLVNNVAVPFPDNGVGVNLAFQATDEFALTLHASDSAAVASVSPFRTLKENEGFYAAQASFALPALSVSDVYGGTLRVMGWHTQIDNVSGSGFAVNLEDGLTDDAIVFLRYGYADADVSDFRQSWSGGIQLATEGIGRTGDALGIAGVWSQPSDDTLREESLIEVYYRFQVNGWVQLSPDLQYVINPTSHPAADDVWIVGLRAQVDF